RRGTACRAPAASGAALRPRCATRTRRSLPPTRPPGPTPAPGPGDARGDARSHLPLPEVLVGDGLEEPGAHLGAGDVLLEIAGAPALREARTLEQPLGDVDGDTGAQGDADGVRGTRVEGDAAAAGRAKGDGGEEAAVLHARELDVLDGGAALAD